VKKFKLNFCDGDSGTKKCIRGYGGLFGGSLESGGRIFVGAFGRNLALVAMNMFSRLIYFAKTFYKSCSSSEICKINAAISYINFQHKTTFSRQFRLVIH
jgi:hypothetical protein